MASDEGLMRAISRLVVDGPTVPEAVIPAIMRVLNAGPTFLSTESECEQYRQAMEALRSDMVEIRKRIGMEWAPNGGLLDRIDHLVALEKRAAVAGLELPRTPVDEHALVGEFDARVWAREFCRMTGFPDEGWALSWFANAIMCGYDNALGTGFAPRKARTDA